MAKSYLLTKSKITSGLQCEKRVYMMRPDLMKKYYSHNN